MFQVKKMATVHADGAVTLVRAFLNPPPYPIADAVGNLSHAETVDLSADDLSVIRAALQQARLSPAAPPQE